MSHLPCISCISHCFICETSSSLYKRSAMHNQVSNNHVMYYAS